MEPLPPGDPSFFPPPSWIVPGVPAWYQSAPGHFHRGVVASWPRTLCGAIWVVELGQMDDSYAAIAFGRRRIAAAACCALSPDPAPGAEVMAQLHREAVVEGALADQVSAMLDMLEGEGVPLIHVREGGGFEDAEGSLASSTMRALKQRKEAVDMLATVVGVVDKLGAVRKGDQMVEQIRVWVVKARRGWDGPSSLRRLEHVEPVEQVADARVDAGRELPKVDQPSGPLDGEGR